MDLPDPFDEAGFLAGLAERRGRPIELVALAAWSGAQCGLVVATDRADYVFVTADTSPLHQRHIVLHEAGHLLCGHTGGGALPDAVAASLTPNLSVELVRRVLGRTTYDRGQEREAELVASLIMRRVDAGADAPPDRLRSAFGS
ncbi:hypothetical protein [Saccharothrix australiensis]|uniref:hypothetical protein n=1 Tax=Saccharothrix australiensis TaxID=2072 RepID=UPI001FE39DFD|nr:hypothetical protein [Saccharothrix australiensis]